MDDRGSNLWWKFTTDISNYVRVVDPALTTWSPAFIKVALLEAWGHPGMIAVAVYRYGQWARFRNKVPIFRQMVLLHYYLLYWWVRTSLGIEVSAQCKIGEGFQIYHFGGIILHSETTAGRNLRINSGVIIGSDSKFRVPVLGNDVDISVGAKVFGGITVGDDVTIGAGAVVSKSCPDHSIVAGVPAKVIRYKPAHVSDF